MEEKLFAKWGGLLETIDETDGNHESERINRIQKNIIALEKANGWEEMKNCLDTLKDDKDYICSPLLDILLGKIENMDSELHQISILKSGNLEACKFLLEHCPEICEKIHIYTQHTLVNEVWKLFFISLGELIEFIDIDLFKYLLTKIRPQIDTETMENTKYIPCEGEYSHLYGRAANCGKVEIMLYLEKLNVVQVIDNNEFFDFTVISNMGKYPKMIEAYIDKLKEYEYHDFLFEQLGENAIIESLEIILEKLGISDEDYGCLLDGALSGDNVEALKFIQKHRDLKELVKDINTSTLEHLGSYHTDTIVFLVENECFSGAEAVENAALYRNMKLMQCLLEEKKVALTEKEMRWVFYQGFESARGTDKEDSVAILKYLMKKFAEHGVQFTEEEMRENMGHAFYRDSSEQKENFLVKLIGKN